MEDLLSISVFQPRVTQRENTPVDWSTPDLQPYVMEVLTKEGNWRVHRNFQSILQLNEMLAPLLQDQIPVLPTARGFFGRFFFGQFADTEAAEQRRSDVAKHINQLISFCRMDEEAGAIFLSFFTSNDLFSAIEAGDLDEVKKLLLSQRQDVWDCKPPYQTGTLHFLAELFKREEGRGSVDVANVLFAYGADVNQKDMKFRSPLMVAMNGENKEMGEVWKTFVKLLIQKGSNLLELNGKGENLLHRCVYHKDLVEYITLRVDRIKDQRDFENRTPYTLATNLEVKDCQQFFRSSGAQNDEDFAIISEAMEEQTKQFDSFLEESRKLGDTRELVTILLRQADLQLLNDPIVTAKILNCALVISESIQMSDKEEIYEKIIQAFNRLAFIHQQDIKLPKVSSFTECLKKRRTKLKDIRASMPNIIGTKKVDFALKWISEQFCSVLKNAISDTFSYLSSPPCLYAIMMLGPFSNFQCTPSTPVQFAVLTERSDNATLEYFRTFSRILEMNMIQLQETPYNVLRYGTESPISGGLQFDTKGNIPEAFCSVPPFSLLGSAFQLALLQEPNYFKENANAGATLWEAAFLVGDKKLFDTYRLEMGRVLKRRENVQSRALHQKRAAAMIKTDFQSFIPKMNRDVDAENRFEMYRYLVLFPTRIINWLCWYYDVDISVSTMWERIDRLCSATVLSKEGAKNLKMALSSIWELFLRTGEKKVVDIGTSINSFNIHNIPYDSDDDEVKPPSQVATMQLDQSSSLENNMGGNGEKQKEEEALYALTKEDIDQIAEIYCVLLPLHSALRIWLFEEGKDHPEKALLALQDRDMLNTSNSTLAEVYQRLCHYEKAKTYYRAAIKQDDSNYTALNTFGVMWNKLGNYKKAIKYYEKAVVVIEKQKGPDAPQLATQFNNLAMANVNLEQNLEAIQWLEKALAVDKAVYGDTHAFVARDLRNIGLMALKEKQWEKALDYLQNGFSIESENNGLCSSQIASYYNDIARVYQGMGQFDESISYFEKALSVDRQLYTDAHPSIGSRYLSLAAIYQDCLKKPNESLSHYERALEIFKEVHGDDHLSVAGSLFKCGSLTCDMEQYERSFEYLKKAFVSFKKIKGENDKETQVAYKKMKEVELILQKLFQSGPEYAKWKRMMEEKRELAELENSQSTMQVEAVDDNDEMEWVPKVYGPGSVQKSKKDVFEDNFFEL